MNGRKANKVIDVKPATVSYEYGQIFETDSHPHGIMAMLSNGGSSLSITSQHSPEAMENYRLAKGLGIKKSAIKRLGMDVPDDVLNYQFDGLGINPSSPVEVNGSQVGIGELVESYYTHAMELQAQQKLFPTLRRLAPGMLVGGVGFAAAAGIVWLTTYSNVLSSNAYMLYDAIDQIVTTREFKITVNLGIEMVSLSGGLYLGARMSKKRSREITELKEQTADLSETLRLALLEEGKKAGSLHPNYGVMRRESGGGYVPAVKRR